MGLAQDCTDCPNPLDREFLPDEWSFTKQVNEVNVLFVAAQHGRFAADLVRDDITILDDNKPPAAVLAFRNERELVLRAGLLIDTSNSVTSRFRFEKDAATAFLRQALNRSSDQAFILGFNDHARLAQDFTGNPELLKQAVANLAIGGGTALYDAIRIGCEKLRREAARDGVSRVLIVLSDGQNNAGASNLAVAIEAAQQAEVTIYAISTNYPGERNYSENFAAQDGNSNLRKLAQQSGGRVLFPVRPEYLPRAFAAIDDELRSRYAICYRPADFIPDGHYRAIKLEAHKGRERLQVRARSGYHATLAFLHQPVSEGTDSSLRVPRR
jgi:VWFA-related protein